jgi:glycosyltransferase involved in cell wall biosynthesis
MSDSLAPTLLSVCIPTYNRIALLRQSLSVLLPQLNEECELIVIDNASADDVATELKDLLSPYPHLKVRLLRNAANVGAGANILRCFENARGPWVYVLGDDDHLASSAIADILAETARFPEATYINFQSNILDIRNVSRPATFTATGLDGFVRGLDEFSNLLFLSTGVYCRSKIIPALRIAYYYLPAMAPHTCLLFVTLANRGGLTVFSDRRIVRWQPPETGVGWNSIVVDARLPTMLELIPDAALRKIWYEKVARIHRPPIQRLLKSFFSVVFQKGDVATVRDDVQLASYLGVMVPELRGRAVRLWLVILLAEYSWWPFYVGLQALPIKGWLRKKIRITGEDDVLARQLIRDQRL